MRVVFRTDASLAIGSGHVMRCLSLAEAIRQAGGEVAFVCRTMSGNLCDYIADQGYSVHRLPAASADAATSAADGPPHVAWLTVYWQQDAEQTLASLSEPVDWLVVDHYALDARWERFLRQKTKKLMVIDDLADRPHDCDLLLDQNLHPDAADRYDGLVPVHCCRLIGPRHALLRPGFAAIHAARRSRDGQIGRLLVFFGGVDAGNETGKALAALAQIPEAAWQVDVVVGAANQYRRELEAYCQERAAYTFHCQTPAMPQLMAQADLALGAGGTAQLERCAVGLPSLLLCLADNQLSGCRAMAADGSALYLGRAEDSGVADMADALRFCLRSPELLRHVGQRACRLVDGQGGLRVVGAMGLGGGGLRLATPEDCEDIFVWRNHELTRRFSKNPRAISLDEHKCWYSKAILDPTSVLLIAEDFSGPLGVLRYDLIENVAKISVYLVPGRHGKGMGSVLVTSGEHWLKHNHPSVNKIIAEVLPDNTASMRSFIKSGFVAKACILEKYL